MAYLEVLHHSHHLCSIRRRNGAQRLQNGLQLITWHLSEVELNETVAQCPREHLDREKYKTHTTLTYTATWHRMYKPTGRWEIHNWHGTSKQHGPGTISAPCARDKLFQSTQLGEADKELTSLSFTEQKPNTTSQLQFKPVRKRTEQSKQCTQYYLSTSVLASRILRRKEHEPGVCLHDLTSLWNDKFTVIIQHLKHIRNRQIQFNARVFLYSCPLLPKPNLWRRWFPHITAVPSWWHKC